MAQVDTSEFERKLRRLANRFGSKEVLNDLELIAQDLLKKAVDSPIPRDVGTLAASGLVVKDTSRNRITFGFNRIYAAFQDAPNRRGQYTLRPKFKRWLYVPISQAGRRHRTGVNPESEGLIFGGFVRRVGGGNRSSNPAARGGGGAADYILAKEVVIPIRPYGSALGPNHYFSETIKRNRNKVLKDLGLRLSRRLGREFRRSS